MQLLTIPVRFLLQYNTEELKNLLTGRFFIQFEDNSVIETNSVTTVFTSYVWDLIRTYPNIQVTSEHHLATYLGKGGFSDKTTNKLYTAIYKSVAKLYSNNDANFSRSEFMRKVYEVNNRLYNAIHSSTLAWATSLDILDFKEILDNPDIKAIKQGIKPTPDGVDNGQKDIINAIKTLPALQHNVIAKGTRSGIMSSGQVVKCIGPCGFGTDVDGFIFPKPILRGYAEGIRNFTDSMIESRSGAKSLAFAKSPLQMTEYFSRTLQISTSTLMNVHHGDCGSTSYINWFVKDKVLDEDGRLVYSGDLERLLGTYYLDPDTKQLTPITRESTHLIGKSIKIRNVLHCRHPDPYGICSKCFGDLYFNKPDNANIGHLCTVYMTSKNSQTVLSVKHLDNSATVDKVAVAPEHAKFLTPQVLSHSYRLNKASLGLKPTLIISRKEFNYAHVQEVDDVSQLAIHRTSYITDLVVEHYLSVPKAGEDPNLMHRTLTPIPVSIKRRYASFTKAFLAYIKEKGVTYDRKKNIIIDVEEWLRTKPEESILTLPLKHHSMADYSRDIESLLHSNMSELYKRKHDISTTDLLTELFELVNEKMSVNIAILSVILLATRIVDDTTYDYSIPKDHTVGHFGVHLVNMCYRSVSAMMAYEKHSRLFITPVSYIKTRRPDHPLDALIVPELMLDTADAKEFYK